MPGSWFAQLKEAGDIELDSQWNTIVRKWNMTRGTNGAPIPPTSNDTKIDIPGEYRTSPMSEKELAEIYGGTMTQQKIAAMIKSGALRTIEISRQSRIFDKRQLPKHVIDKLSKID